LTLLLLLACTDAKDDTGTDAVRAIVDPTRAEHYFDVPFPSDDLRDAQGFVSLAGYPVASEPLAGGIVEGWRTRVESTTQGFGNNSAAYFRFEAAVDLPAATTGAADDPVLFVGLDTPERLPLVTRFVADPQGDPFYAPNTLALAPALGFPPRSGERYAAVIMRSAGVAAPEGYTLPAGVEDALVAAGVEGQAAVATVFTVQDAVGQLQQLFADVDTRTTAGAEVTLKRAIRIAYTQGATPSGKHATLATITFEDGTTDVAYLEGYAPEEAAQGTHTNELDETWPMAVYAGSIPVWNYQGLADRPYMSPGLAHISDVERRTGWIQFSGGALASEPEVESMRIVVSIPWGTDGAPRTDAPLVIWDHGTGGHAWNSVQRQNAGDDGRALAEAFAGAGFAVVGRDAPLYGTRYPLIDEGYGASLGFYNIVNLPAFRDNQRQTAVDGHTLLNFVRDGGLNDALPAGSIDSTRVRRFGHSLGSVTANLGVSAEPDAYESVFLSGSGGSFTNYFLDTGLLVDLDPTLITSLFGLVGQEPPDEVTPAGALGALLGLDEGAWGQVDRLHPVITLFQWTMDPSDPLAVARSEDVDTTMVICTGDRQVPNFTSVALLEALPRATSYEVAASTDDYDPHVCLHREEPARVGLRAWLAE
jgi:hypothetical protein